MELTKKFAFMWNDGIAFFSTMADHKLPRLTGAKPGWFDKLKNTRNIAVTMISLSVLFIVLNSQLSKFNTQKSQEVLLKPKHEFFYNSSTSLPLIACFYLNVDNLFDSL